LEEQNGAGTKESEEKIKSTVEFKGPEDVPLRIVISQNERYQGKKKEKADKKQYQLFKGILLSF
jgi:hypothetical protein